MIMSLSKPHSKVTSAALRNKGRGLSSSANLINNVAPSLLAEAWTAEVAQFADSTMNSLRITKAVEHTLPLLTDGPESVPFVCRYRTDVIDPLTTKQVHVLQSLLSKHASLENLRSKLSQVLPTPQPPEVLTSTSKTELEDWYAPYKPPPKGSILQRIQQDYPQLVEFVEDLWQGKVSDLPSGWRQRLGPHESMVQLLASKLAAEPVIATIVTTELEKHCKIGTSIPKKKAKMNEASTAKRSKSNTNGSSTRNKYEHYDGFRRHLMHVKDHQVLAIRRGIQQKEISMSYDIDGEKMESSIFYHIRSKNLAPPVLLRNHRDLLNEAIHDAWTRLLRRRGTSRLWSAKCTQAEERAYIVFQTNLQRALLAPPTPVTSNLLALDPGYQAGIKCAILNGHGVPQRLETVQFLGSQHSTGIDKLGDLLKDTAAPADKGNGDEQVTVALGNGHGSQECRHLLQEASKEKGISVNVHLVNEAGTSVWSVTEAAEKEFPKKQAAAIAAISIGRRLLNPLGELIKVPPRSLGLGMYQHDLNEKELEERLHLATIDSVATVGVDINACSLEILEKVPGLSKLASKIIKKRPLQQRSDLLQISGLGPKTFEYCAAFCRIQASGSLNALVEPLDATMVHPESYDMARWLLNRMEWRLDQPISNLPRRAKWYETWKSVIEMASTKFQVSQDRVLSVLVNLVDSIMDIDPRTKEDKGLSHIEGDEADVCKASTKGCSLLPSDLARSTSELAAAAPVRGITGIIRNISDFGAFIDFGGHNDGLLHSSKLGPKLSLDQLLIGQSIGVDILSVSGDKVSLGLHGLSFQSQNRARRHQDESTTKSSRKRKR